MQMLMVLCIKFGTDAPERAKNGTGLENTLHTVVKSDHIPPIMKFLPETANVAKRPNVKYFVNSASHFHLTELFEGINFKACFERR